MPADELRAGPNLPEWRKYHKIAYPERQLSFNEDEVDHREQQKALDRHRIQHRKLSNKNGKAAKNHPNQARQLSSECG